MSTQHISAFWAYECIAVVGLTPRQEEMANQIYQQLKESGHRVYAVSAEIAWTMDGDPCYPDVKSLPQRPDGVIIVCPPETAAKVVHDCAEAMIQQVWIHNTLRCDGSCAFTEVITYCQQHKIEVIATGASEARVSSKSGHTLMSA